MADTIEAALDTIGMDLHFSTQLKEITWEALKTILPHDPSFQPSFDFKFSNSSNPPNPFPPFIAVHSRRNDFDAFCAKDSNGKPDVVGCFTPLSTYAEAVSEIRSELIRENPALSEVDIPVILFSDEPKHMNAWFKNRYHRPEGFSEGFWKEVDVLRWKVLDHELRDLRTNERLGMWYPILIDSVVMSHAVGFVGTKKSTFSLMPAKRVEGWWKGPVRMVSAVVEKGGR